MGIFKRKKTKQVEELQPIQSPATPYHLDNLSTAYPTGVLHYPASGAVYLGHKDYKKPKLKPMQSLLVALLRHVLTFIGATIVSKGLIDEATMVELVGAAISFLSVGWMAVDKVKKKPE